MLLIPIWIVAIVSPLIQCPILYHGIEARNRLSNRPAIQAVCALGFMSATAANYFAFTCVLFNGCQKFGLSLGVAGILLLAWFVPSAILLTIYGWKKAFSYPTDG
jgi:hypothetical protein